MPIPIALYEHMAIDRDSICHQPIVYVANRDSCYYPEAPKGFESREVCEGIWLFIDRAGDIWLFYSATDKGYSRRLGNFWTGWPGRNR